MRADRLLALMLLLQARGRMTAADLAQRLEVSVRTIYRDIDALGAAGVPVYTEAGTGGGCQLLDGYRSPLHGVSSDEATVLLTLGVPEPLREIGLTSALELVHLDMPRWFRSRETVPHLTALAEAIRKTNRATVTYRGAVRRRTVDPLGLVNKAGVWYLVAVTSSRRTAVFRVGRVTACEMLDASFDRPDDFDLVAYWNRWSAEFEASRPRLAVTVHASPDALAALPETFGDGALAVLASAEPPDADGWRTITLSFENEQAAAYRLAGFGDLVIVISPASVRDLVIQTAEGILRRHAATSTE